MDKENILDLLGADTSLNTLVQESIKVRKKNELNPFVEIVTVGDRIHYRFGEFDPNGFVITTD